MFSDRHGNPTDDSNEWLFGHETTFDADPAPDFEGMEYDDHRRGPKCGGPGFDGNGCRGCGCCDPVSGEDKPYGWGLETFEDPALERANAAANAEFLKRPVGKYTSAWVETWGMGAGKSPHRACYLHPDDIRAFRDMCWRVWSTQNRRLTACSDRKWERICERAETHTQAVVEYAAWAEKVTGRRKN